MSSFTPISNTFVKQISSTEFNSNKEDYTKKALLELNEQMKTFKRPIIKTKQSINNNIIDVDNIVNDEDDLEEDLEEDLDNNLDTLLNKYNDKTDKTDKHDHDVNLIIKHVIDNKTNSKSCSKTNTRSNTRSNSNKSNVDDNIINSIYAQHEVDINTIAKLNKLIIELQHVIKDNEREYNDMDSKMHYLKLDLGNCQIDKDTSIKEAKFYKKKSDFIDNSIKSENETLKKEKKYIKYIKIFIVMLLAFNAYLHYFKYFMLIGGVVFLYI